MICGSYLPNPRNQENKQMKDRLNLLQNSPCYNLTVTVNSSDRWTPFFSVPRWYDAVASHCHLFSRDHDHVAKTSWADHYRAPCGNRRIAPLAPTSDGWDDRCVRLSYKNGTPAASPTMPQFVEIFLLRALVHARCLGHCAPGRSTRSRGRRLVPRGTPELAGASMPSRHWLLRPPHVAVPLAHAVPIPQSAALERKRNSSPPPMPTIKGSPGLPSRNAEPAAAPP
jgi:hypothetical protein